MDADHLAIVEQGRAAESDLAQVLEGVRDSYTRYVGFALRAQPIALTLWTAHTHAIDAADCTPYIRISSAEKSSGKTRTEEVAYHLVRSGVRASSISASALFRLIDARHPTLLVDEVDAIFTPKSEQDDLRSILNAGYERGNPVYRSVAVGKQWDANAYEAFCPKMLAGLENGRLPDTIISRSIPIGLQRKRKSESSISKFRKRTDPPRLHELRAALEAWATEDVIASLAATYPEPAEGLTDRQDDIWEPLLAIADLAGGDWPALARAAAVELHSGDTENESYGVLLLADVRDVLTEPIATFDLAVRLVKVGDRGPWADWWGKLVESDSDASRKSVGHQVARHLRRYGIKPKQVTVEGKNVRGFAPGDFADAFERYLPPLPPPENARTLSRRSEALLEAEAEAEAEDTNTPPDQASSVLAFQVGENGHAPMDGPERVRIVRETLAAHAGAGSPGTAAAFELNTLGIEPPPGRATWTATGIEHFLNGQKEGG